jgi:hypothetical protein
VNQKAVKRIRRETKRFLSEHHREMFLTLFKKDLYTRVKVAIVLIFKIGYAEAEANVKIPKTNIKPKEEIRQEMAQPITN